MICNETRDGECKKNDLEKLDFKSVCFDLFFRSFNNISLFGYINTNA